MSGFGASPDTKVGLKSVDTPPLLDRVCPLGVVTSHAVAGEGEVIIDVLPRLREFGEVLPLISRRVGPSRVAMGSEHFVLPASQLGKRR